MKTNRDFLGFCQMLCREALAVLAIIALILFFAVGGIHHLIFFCGFSAIVSAMIEEDKREQKRAGR